VAAKASGAWRRSGSTLHAARSAHSPCISAIRANCHLPIVNCSKPSPATLARRWSICGLPPARASLRSSKSAISWRKDCTTASRRAWNFLNLQVQLLGDAVERNDNAETREIVPLLRHGVEESYQDVRELLHNFRSRLTTGDMRPAVEDTVARFRRQCRTDARLTIEGSGPPLQPEQQLQVLFILQEALSNVRKHAMAEHVTISLTQGRDFQLVVQDDGEGFDPSEFDGQDSAHVGLHIMQERASRLGAT
jgi:two-component sensor histidine kinase